MSAGHVVSEQRSGTTSGAVTEAHSGDSDTIGRTGRWRRWVGAVLIAAVAGGAGWWAARATLPSTAPVVAATELQQTATSRTGSVGRELTMAVNVVRPFTEIASNSLAGVVTATRAPGETAVGDELYQVAGVPVRAVAGTTPFYRDLAVGAKGTDVSQLNGALITLGHLTGEPSTDFNGRTQAAVRAWQRATGQEQTGSVTLGELVAVPTLPGPVQLGEEIATGRIVTGGEPAVLAPTTELRFELVLTSDQAAGVVEGTRVTVPFEELSWEAVVSGSTTGDDGNVTFTLTAPDGGAVCGTECDALPAQEKTSLLSSVEVVPAVEGVTVPVAAVRTASDGSTYVSTADGQDVPVTVAGSAGGVAVVEGLDDGVDVLLSGGRDA